MADKTVLFVDADGENLPVKFIDNGDNTYSQAMGAVDANLLPVKSTGETFTLLASAARGATAGTNGTPVDIPTRVAFALLLDFTAKGTDVTDTCDVYIDMLIGATWVNAIHFTQVLGNAADASAQYALLMPSADVAPLDVSANAGNGVVRPNVVGSQMRARWVIVDPGAGAASFTFSITVWAI